MTSDQNKKTKNCPIYTFGINEFFEKLGKGADRPIVPIGKFHMDEEGEKYLLSKIPQPLIFENPSTKEKIEIVVSDNYCWYTEISEVFAQKGDYRHIFKLKDGVLEYDQTSYSYVSLVSIEE